MSNSWLQSFAILTFLFTIQISATPLGCNGGLGVYKTVKGNIKTTIYKSFVDACLKEVKNNHVLRWGCYSASSGPNCKCNLDTNYIFDYDTVYNSAVRSMMVTTDGFGYNEAETYEGNMYISYQCKQEGEGGNEEIPGDEE